MGSKVKTDNMQKLDPRLLVQSIRPAFLFMSTLPMGNSTVSDEQAWAYSVLWYPLVGIVIGVVTVCAGLLLPFEPPLNAGILLLLIVLLTGALHLDGLADCMDAWTGGIGDRSKTLQIMKDPRSGPMAVVAIVMVLLLKFVALWQLLEANSLALLILAPMLSRVAVQGLILFTNYVGDGFIGGSIAVFTKDSEKSNEEKNVSTLLFQAFILWLLASFLLFPQAGFIALVLATAIMTACLRFLFVSRLGGYTGDCAGALIELVELFILILGLVLLL